MEIYQKNNVNNEKVNVIIHAARYQNDTSTNVVADNQRLFHNEKYRSTIINNLSEFTHTLSIMINFEFPSKQVYQYK